MSATGPEQKVLIGKALRYSNRASERERLFISGVAANLAEDYPKAIKEFRRLAELHPDDKDAFFLMGSVYSNMQQLEQGIRALTRAIEIDPLYAAAYNLLAYTYNAGGDFEKSIWAIDKYISLAPDEANPYDSRGDLYAWNGKLDQAIESYRKALQVKPDFYPSLIKLGDMYLLRREYAGAESCYKQLASCPDKEMRSTGRWGLGGIPAYQGKFEEALRVLDDGLAADRMEGAAGDGNVGKHSTKAAILVEKQDFDSALIEARAVMEISRSLYPADPVYNRDFYIRMLLRAGRIAETEQVLNDLRRDLGDKYPTYMWQYWRPLGDIELAKGNLTAALVDLEMADTTSSGPYYSLRETLAQAYLKAGKLGEAVAVLEQMFSRYDSGRAFCFPGVVKDHYILGTAYEKSGWTGKAIEQYQAFLEIWKDADPGIPEVEDARQRLARLNRVTTN